MKKLLIVCATIFALTSVMVANAALLYDQNIVAIFGAGNPNTGWTVGADNGITLALRAKNRETASTANTSGVYYEPVGYQAPANNRARWNWEFSIDSGANVLSTYDYYVGVDTDPSQCVNHVVVNALAFWSDNSYGTASTLNGQGLEGLASSFPSATIAQQSQNLVFAGGNPTLNATYTYVLYAVASGGGPGGTKLAETQITVVVGTGGAPCPDTDGDGVPDNVDSCPNSGGSYVVVGDVITSIVNTINPNGCGLQDLVNSCLSGDNHGTNVSCIVDLADSLYDGGNISKEQRKELVTAVAKNK